jgi:hypothetical protein
MILLNILAVLSAPILSQAAATGLNFNCNVSVNHRQIERNVPVEVTANELIIGEGSSARVFSRVKSSDSSEYDYSNDVTHMSVPAAIFERANVLLLLEHPMDPLDRSYTSYDCDIASQD